jgi:hypothetical protein
MGHQATQSKPAQHSVSDAQEIGRWYQADFILALAFVVTTAPDTIEATKANRR